MRLLSGMCALAAIGSAASAQTSGSSSPASPPIQSTSTQRAGQARQGTDSLRLSRRQAIAEALTRNPQIDVAREHIAEARARRVTAVAVPDPSLTAGFDRARAAGEGPHTAWRQCRP